jgi:hypothetical protein
MDGGVELEGRFECDGDGGEGDTLLTCRGAEVMSESNRL